MEKSLLKKNQLIKAMFTVSNDNLLIQFIYFILIIIKFQLIYIYQLFMDIKLFKICIKKVIENQ